MKITLVHSVIYDNSFFTLRKTIKSEFVPRQGDFITDPAFEEDYEVGEVHVDLESQSCEVFLKALSLNVGLIEATKIIDDNYGVHYWSKS